LYPVLILHLFGFGFLLLFGSDRSSTRSRSQKKSQSESSTRSHSQKEQEPELKQQNSQPEQQQKELQQDRHTRIWFMCA